MFRIKLVPGPVVIAFGASLARVGVGVLQLIAVLFVHGLLLSRSNESTSEIWVASGSFKEHLFVVSNLVASPMAAILPTGRINCLRLLVKLLRRLGMMMLVMFGTLR